MISQDLNCIYVHIPKVAGTSISYELSKYTKHPNILFDIINRLGRKMRNRNPIPHYNYNLKSHAKANEYLEYITKYSDYYIFTFVRNPFDWAVSNYEYVKQRQYHPSYDYFNKMSFYEYVKALPYKGRFQLDYILDRNENIIVDFVGKYENIDNDIKEVNRKLGVDLNIGNRNKSMRGDWTQYYDNETAELVVNKFIEDFLYFNYSTTFP
jgi:hypothetical protein